MIMCIYYATHQKLKNCPDGNGGGNVWQRLRASENMYTIAKIRLVRQPVIVYIFSDAAQSVAAHFPLRAIRVEHPHTEVPFLGRTDQYHSVRNRLQNDGH